MNEPPESRELVQEWLDLAQDDLEGARTLHQAGRWRQTRILSQQSAEKFLKAMLKTARRKPHALSSTLRSVLTRNAR